MTKKTLLIADDDKLLHQMYTDALDDEYEILHAYDGAEALLMAVEHQPDLIILDVLMPLLDGRAICKKIKSNPQTAHIKILMLSAKDSQFDRLVGLEVGADDYVEKPLTADLLKNFVSKILSMN